MVLTSNESVLVLWIAGILLSTFFGAVIWVLNKGVNRMESMSVSLTNMEKDFKVLVNDHVNLKHDVDKIDNRVRVLEKHK